MTTILFNATKSFETGVLRAMLRVNFPDFNWAFSWHALQQPGMDLEVGVDEIADSLIITGTNDAGAVLAMEILSFRHRFDGEAPEHEWHARLESAVHDESLRRPFEYMVCYALIGLQGAEARGYCLLAGGREWLDIAALRALIEADCGKNDEPGDVAPPVVDASPPTAIIAGDGPAGPESTASHDRICRMPALILLLSDLPNQIDCTELARFVRLVDPQGGWSVEPGGPAQVLARGRGSALAISLASDACPSVNMPLTQARSFWFSGDPAEVAAHRAHIRIESDIDTSSDWIASRQTAKVMAFLASHLAGQCATLAVYNDAIGTIYGPNNCKDMLEVLSHGRLPISLWVWTVMQPLDDGRLGLGTLGLEAFLGYEAEAWNLTLEPVEAQKRFSAILAYLFDQGPVVRHGDTIGTPGDDSGTLCRFADQGDLARGRPTAVLKVTYDVSAQDRAALLGQDSLTPSGCEAAVLGPAFVTSSDSFDFSSFAA